MEDNLVRLHQNMEQMVHLYCSRFAPTEGNKADLYKILNAAAMKWYHSHEVIADNPDTFFRSSSFQYADVICPTK